MGRASCSARSQTVQPQTATEQSAYDKWLDQTSAREEARLDRIHGAVGVIPATLWIVLFFIAAVIFVFMLFFADRGERAVVQGMLIGSVVSVMAALMLLLNGLDDAVPRRRGRAATGRDGAVAADHRRGAGRGRRAGRSSRATRSGSRCRRDGRRRGSRQGGARGDRAARRRDRRDGVERLPVDPVERRAGEGGRRARTRCGSSRPRRPGSRTPRREIDVATFTQWVNAYALKQTRAGGLLLQALPRGVQARRRRVGRDQAAQEPERAADAVRDAAVQARGARRGRAARRAGGGLRRAGAPRTSSARRTTCSASSCSRRRCSSPA